MQYLAEILETAERLGCGRGKVVGGLGYKSTPGEGRTWSKELVDPTGRVRIEQQGEERGEDSAFGPRPYIADFVGKPVLFVDGTRIDVGALSPEDLVTLEKNVRAKFQAAFDAVLAEKKEQEEAARKRHCDEMRDLVRSLG